jgi:hypothetical protein
VTVRGGWNWLRVVPNYGLVATVLYSSAEPPNSAATDGDRVISEISLEDIGNEDGKWL